MLVKHTLCLLLLFILQSVQLNAQDYSALWEQHFSYRNIIDVSQSAEVLYAASENAIFTYNFNTNELNTISSINGLSGEAISTIHYSTTHQLLLIGYESGLIEVLLDNDDNVLTVIDIVEKPTIPPGNKQINHFNEYNNTVLISADFGISVFDLNNLEFGDTYYIGNFGAQVQVKHTTIYDNHIYAATQNAGIRKAAVDNPNLIDYQQWQIIHPGNGWIGIEAINDKLFATKANKRLYEIINDIAYVAVVYQPDKIVDIKTESTNLIVTTEKESYVYDDNLNEVFSVMIDSDLNNKFSCGVTHNSNLYVGTIGNFNQGYQGFGVLKYNTNDNITYESIFPQGPLYNYPFRVTAQSNKLWTTFGDYTFGYNPYPLRQRGLSILNDNQWKHILRDSILGARNLVTTAINPFNTEQVFMSSFIDGILELNQEEATFFYDETNSGIESVELPGNPNYIDIRIDPITFDEQGLLWSVTGRIEYPLKSFNVSTNQWQSYTFDDIIIDNPFNDEFGYSSLVIDANNTKWIGSYKNGLIAFNENGNQFKNFDSEDVNMPTPLVTALAIDNSNALWIGTRYGLRVLYNTTNVFTNDNALPQSIIILQDGIAEELLYEQFVTKIVVDGSNNKWIGTIASGVFYFSADGQETLFHFTTSNSPLPSNNINDISIDKSTGYVYIVTDKGMVAYKSDSSAPQTDFENAYIYPNPVRPEFNMADKKVKIQGLTEEMNIKITDIEGNLVAEAQSNTNLRYKGYNLEIDGGTAYWNGKNLANNTVASGVYLVLLTDLDTQNTKILKIMVVR